MCCQLPQQSTFNKVDRVEFNFVASVYWALDKTSVFGRSWRHPLRRDTISEKTNIRFPLITKPPICNLKKYGWLKKIRLISGLAELSRKLKKSAKTWLITSDFGWAVEPKLKWLSTWAMYLLLLSVSLLLQNQHPSIITRSFEITRTIHFNASHLLECWFHFIIQISVFFGGQNCRRIRLSAPGWGSISNRKVQHCFHNRKQNDDANLNTKQSHIVKHWFLSRFSSAFWSYDKYMKTWL